MSALRDITGDCNSGTKLGRKISEIAIEGEAVSIGVNKGSSISGDGIGKGRDSNVGLMDEGDWLIVADGSKEASCALGTPHGDVTRWHRR